VFFCFLAIIGALFLFFHDPIKRATIHATLLQTTSQLTPRQKRWVYIDMGANNGDSVYKFFGFPYPSYKNGYAPKYPTLVSEADVRDNAWIVYVFEANPRFNEPLSKMKKDVESERRQINLFNATAAWVYNGNVTFYAEVSNEDFNFWGSSVKSDFVHKEKTNLTVRCVDISAILRNYTEEDYVVVKFDIEGAEYDLLVRWITENTLRILDVVSIEYHHRAGNHAESKCQELVLESIIKAMGIKSITWSSE
jgi:FkbM family methyltransferase